MRWLPAAEYRIQFEEYLNLVRLFSQVQPLHAQGMPFVRMVYDPGGALTIAELHYLGTGKLRGAYVGFTEGSGLLDLANTWRRVPRPNQSRWLSTAIGL